MAITLTVTESYCTLAEADIYLQNDTTWLAASDEDKTEALLDARYHIDISFYCDLASYDVIPDELKYATAVLASDVISDPSALEVGASVKKEYSKAGSVETSKEYFTGKKNVAPNIKKVRSILKGICSSMSSAVRLSRA